MFFNRMTEDVWKTAREMTSKVAGKEWNGGKGTAYSKSFHRVDIFLGGLGRFFVGIVKLIAFEVPVTSVSQTGPATKCIAQTANLLGSLIRTSPSVAHYSPHELCIDLSSTNAFHHCEMF